MAMSYTPGFRRPVRCVRLPPFLRWLAVQESAAADESVADGSVAD
jgi:hypothetical protein